MIHTAEEGLSVAIIPARGGSKRLPRKNIRPFRGRPILAWSIEAALDSGAFDEVMVSTEDPEIAEVAKRLGASVPFLRTAATASNYSTTSDVLFEVLARYADTDRKFVQACCLYPTAPFVRAEDLLAGKKALLSGSFDVIMPIAPFSYPIWRSLRRDETGRIALNFQAHLNDRSQDLPAAYHDAGQWYWFNVAAFLQEGTLLGGNTGSILLSPMEVQDIDSEEDWVLAEIKHERIFG